MLNARNPALEAPLLADPYDREAWIVYGDWLQQQGDPRGEYIALRAAWLANPSDREARDRLDRCAGHHGDYFRGPLKGELGWSFVDSTGLPMWPTDAITSPEARFVTRLSITPQFEGRVDEIIAQDGPHLPVTVRRLFIGGVDLTTLAPLAATLDRLHELSFRTAIRTDELSSFEFPALRTLDFEYDENNDHFVPRALLGNALPSLVTLRLALWGIDGALVSTIAHAPYAKQLTSLWLFFLTDAAAKVLLDNISRFPALTELMVDDSRMSAEMLRRLDSIPGFGQARAGGYDYRDY